MILCDEFMELRLVAAPHKKIRSHYRNGKPGFPARMAFLHPDVLPSFVEMQEACDWNIVLTDIWRASLVSLNRKYPDAKPMRRTVQPPAWSAHGYGFAIDIDTAPTLKRMKCSKRELDEFMAAHGFHCHRRDHRRGSEDFHFNGLVLPGQDWMRYASKTRTSPAVEQMIRATYGKYWRMTANQKQRCLKFLKLYPGEIDSVFGPWSKTAARSFQKAWRLRADGIIGPDTGRLLQFRCAELRCKPVNRLWTVTG